MKTNRSYLRTADGSDTMELFVRGVPKGAPRPRKSRDGHVYVPSSADVWKQAVIVEAINARWSREWDGPVEVELRFQMSRPKKLGGATSYPDTRKPDLDNLEKTVLDALTLAGVWRDDRQVFRCYSEKVVAAPGDPAGCHIVVRLVACQRLQA